MLLAGVVVEKHIPINYDRPYEQPDNPQPDYGCVDLHVLQRFCSMHQHDTGEFTRLLQDWLTLIHRHRLIHNR
jgi:hypothetical protein